MRRQDSHGLYCFQKARAPSRLIGYRSLCLHPCLRLLPGCAKPCRTRGGKSNTKTCPSPPKIIMYNPETRFKILRHLRWVQEQKNFLPLLALLPQHTPRVRVSPPQCSAHASHSPRVGFNVSGMSSEDELQRFNPAQHTRARNCFFGHKTRGHCVDKLTKSQPRLKNRLLADPGTRGTLRVWCRVCVSAE